MFFLLSKLLDFIIEPLVWVLVLLLLGLFYKKRERRRAFVIAALAVFYFFTNNFIADEFMRAWEVPAVADSSVGTYDVGIVLGGVLAFDKSLNRPQFDRSADRLFQALKLYHQGKIRKLVLDGGSGSIVNKDELEAPILKKYLEQIGVPDSVIAIEPHSRNTHENAVFVKPLLDSLAPHGHYLLITSASHMRRALGCFKKAGIQVTPFSADRYSGPRKFLFDHMFIPNKYALQSWDVMLHEWVGYITYKVMGYL